MVGYLEPMLMAYLMVCLILLEMLVLQEFVHMHLKVVYSGLLVRHYFHYLLVYLVLDYSNLKVLPSPTLVYLLLAMDISMECLVMQHITSRLSTEVMDHSLHSLVLLIQYPSIQKRSNYYSPLLVDTVVSNLLMEHLMVMEYFTTSLVVMREQHLIG